ncbi:MAG: hypothetical protein JJ899_04220 [Alphaproteobacteria bacterium]|nr:hypothetical protein [Alphaproteobacteria bacterium]
MRRSAHANAAFLAFALIWAGMLIGVSFLATPVKFAAPGLTLPVALEVGHVTFHLFSRVEWTFGAALLLAAMFGTSRLRLGIAVLLAIVLALQAAWLLPVLDERVAAVVAGAPLPPSSHHTIYAAAEGAKILLLGIASFTVLRRVGGDKG